MKKIVFCIFFIALSGVCMAKPKIISSELCEYRDVSCDFFGYQKWFKEEISYNQAIEDLDTLVYLLKSAYAGYDDAVKRGLEIDQIIDSFKNSNTENQNIKVSDLNEFIYDFFKPYIQDSHFCIESKDLANTCVTQYRVLYSNIYVKKIEDAFVVEKSDNQDFKIGETLKIESENLFLYPSEGENVYRIGYMTSLNKNEMWVNVSYSGMQRKILCNIDTVHLSCNKLDLYKEVETRNSVYIFIPTLIDLEKSNPLRIIVDENYKKLKSVSERYGNKQYVILDLRTNSGGNDYYALRLLSNLFYAEKDCSDNTTKKNMNKLKKTNLLYEENRIDYISPTIIRAETWFKNHCLTDDSNFLEKFDLDKKLLKDEHKKIAVKNNKKNKPKMQSAKYKGKLIILTGKNTASSAESTVFYAEKIFSHSEQLIVLGENTMGCTAYGNVWCYQLHNSGIALHLPSFISGNSKICPEGLGFNPNYWATNEDIIPAIVNVTGDEELFEKLKDINNNL